jgi:hypothetical protein
MMAFIGIFREKICLRQGDPSPPILFNVVVDMLVVLTSNAKLQGKISGLVPHLVDDGTYAEDIILIMEHNFEWAKNMKLLLCAFEHLSNLKSIFIRVNYFAMGEAKDHTQEYTPLFGCGIEEYPLRYLGIPMHHKRIGNNNWKIIEENIERKLSSWKENIFLMGGDLF